MTLMTFSFRLVFAVLYWRLRDAWTAKRSQRRIVYRLPARHDPGGLIVF